MGGEPGSFITLILRAEGGDLKSLDDSKSLSLRFKTKNKDQFASLIS